MKTLLSIIICVGAFLQTFGATRVLYFVGGFNNWDISHPEVVLVDASGLFEIDIDFSVSREFKLSSVNPEGSWSIFDEGTLYAASANMENEWFPIQEFAKSPNIVAPSKRILTVKVDIYNMRIMFSTENPTRQPWSETLPVMFITTEDSRPVISKEEYLQATYYLDPMGAEGIEAIGSAEDQAALQIRGRGNYTWWGFEKKPYRIKLDKKTALMGMDKSKHFALLAHADDPGAGLRNALGFSVSEALGMPWTPATVPLEVVLNGDYIGLYWLTETVRVDKDRVDVVEQADNAVEDVDGGWLVEIDNYDSDPHITVCDSKGLPIWFTYKSPEILSSDQHVYLQSSMQSIQDALAAGNGVAAALLVDFDILARYFITNQIMLDMESFHGSCYLNRQRGASEKWKFGPVWDFGNAFSQGRGNDPRFIFDSPEFSQHWIGEFYAIPEFVDDVKKVWKEFLGFGPERLDDSLEYWADKIAVAAVNDAHRWPSYAHSDISLQTDRLKTWLGNSVEWLKTQWGSDAMVDTSQLPGFRILSHDGILTIVSNIETSVTITGIDGRSILLNVDAGVSRFRLPAGLYIAAGKKIMLY